MKLCKTRALICSILSLAFAASAGQIQAQDAPEKSLPTGCEFENISFTANFESAKLSSCELAADGSYLLMTDAENRPINPSPWYAFMVDSTTKPNKQASSSIDITIGAVSAKPRYLPKIHMPNGEWQALDFKMTESGMKFSLNVNEMPVKIAAQPIIDNNHYNLWSNDFVSKGLFQKVEIGKSTEGRPIFALVKQQAKNHEWLVLIGRQHPPELTGAVAMLSFADAINQSSASLNAFYDRFNVLIVPNVNPDGVAKGNWRHNTKGADLNRDWGKFQQIETSVVNAYLERLLTPSAEQSPRLVFALDFHSTQQDIFYTMPNDYTVAPADFSDKWLDNVKANTVSSFVVRNRPGTSPGRGVFKQFIADTYNVHAVTYEMGDNTPHALIEHVAQVSAAELIKNMLNTPSADFVYQHQEKLTQ